LDIEGKEHLDAALEHGRGAVLWRMRFCSTHVAKQALAEVGVSMVHVGAARHGARFDNAIGRRIVAPLYRRAEDRHLARRILIAEDGSLEYLRELLEELRANQVISIFGAFPGRASVRRVVCGAELEFATGAPSLTRRSGAVLLTMYTHRLFRDSYRVVIQKPIEPTGGDRTAYLGGAVDEFARRLEDAIRRHPGSWYGWKALTSAA
jgi:lauroyl/myristoyl acyltransferase